ncbi:MAG: glycosyltransferase family 2 protein [Eubacteriaceae bacterium]|nr:glycosyltransferase family 2 protein [Eubacteriaceae bacterium]
MPAISVIIPTYGEPHFLSRTIHSVLNQTFYDFEVFVIDDNNPDTDARTNTEIVMNTFSDERLHYIKHPQNLNGSAARNTGIAEATGKYISFLDSDDEYNSERLQKCFDAMENASCSVAGVYTGCEFRRNGKMYHTMTDIKPGNFLVDTLACTFNLGTGSNLFIRKSVIDEINGFDDSFLRHQDYEFLVRIFEKYELESVPEVLVIKNNENVNLPNVEKIIDIKKQYLDKYKLIINERTDSEKKYIYHSQYIQIAEAAQKTKKYELANQYYKKAKNQGGLSIKEQLRRIAFLGKNLIRR